MPADCDCSGAKTLEWSCQLSCSSMGFAYAMIDRQSLSLGVQAGGTATHFRRAQKMVVLHCTVLYILSQFKRALGFHHIACTQKDVHRNSRRAHHHLVRTLEEGFDGQGGSWGFCSVE